MDRALANQEQRIFNSFMLLLGIWVGGIVGIVLFSDFTEGREADKATVDTDVAARSPHLEKNRVSANKLMLEVVWQ